MGGRLARRLIGAGYGLTIYDTSEAAMQAFAEMGAHPADSPAAVASACEIVMTCLPTPPVVQAVAIGANGIADGNRVKIFIDMSTTGATYAKRIAEGLAARKIVAVELLNNLLSATAMAISSEAIVMGVKAGLDPKQMVDVINAGTGRNSATEDKIPRCVIPRTFNTGFSIALLNKDVRLCLEEADTLGIPMVVGNAVRQLLSITMATEGPDADMTETVKPLERWARVEVGKTQSDRV